ncbi:unnamed protein product [Ophioblennius macclurei]
MQQDAVDVKALRARFNSKHSTSDTSSRDSGSPKSPRPGFGRAVLPVVENETSHRLSPTPPPFTLTPTSGAVRLPSADHSKASPRPPAPPPGSGARSGVVPGGDSSKVKQTGELLQNMMLRQQKTPAYKPRPGPGPISGPSPGPGLTSTPAPPLPRQQHRQRSAGEVTPLRRPLPPEGPLPLKPKRPPSVKLDAFLAVKRGPAPAAPRKGSLAMPGPASIRPPLPAVLSPPKLPQRINKPKPLPHQIASIDIDDDQETYDDIASFDKSGSCSDNSSHCLDKEDPDDVYESIDEESVEANRSAAEKKKKKEAKKQQQQEKYEKLELKKRLNELKKKFQLQGEVEVLHTARVRHDWQGGGKLDLSVQQGESVEIIRVENNPGGKWLARSLAGQYGYISNTCVDVDYEAIKRNVLQSKRPDAFQLPPPPPDPPMQFKMESNRNSSIIDEDEDNYDDVQPLTDDFPLPPPPPEISIDPRVEKELKKKFKFEGPLVVLHTMMVDPNCIIKKPGGKDLHVTRGEIVDVIQLTNDKKVLCRSDLGKYGYVPRSYLLPMEGDIYDDVDAVDVYDNDAPY